MRAPKGRHTFQRRHPTLPRLMCRPFGAPVRLIVADPALTGGATGRPPLRGSLNTTASRLVELLPPLVRLVSFPISSDAPVIRFGVAGKHNRFKTARDGWHTLKTVPKAAEGARVAGRRHRRANFSNASEVAGYERRRGPVEKPSRGRHGRCTRRHRKPKVVIWGDTPT
jgi:hypothetical protein